MTANKQKTRQWWNTSNRPDIHAKQTVSCKCFSKDLMSLWWCRIFQQISARVRKKYVFKWLTDFREQMESIIEAICYVVKFLKQEIALLNKSHRFQCLEMSKCWCVCVRECECEGGRWWEGCGSAVLMVEQRGGQFRNFSTQWQPDTSSLAWKSTDTDYTIRTLFTNMSHTASEIKSKY